jgi:hypothetical protein
LLIHLLYQRRGGTPPPYLLRNAEMLKASRAASPRRNEEVTGYENRGYLSSSSSSSEIEYEDDDEDEDETSRQLEVIGKGSGFYRCGRSFIVPSDAEGGCDVFLDGLLSRRLDGISLLNRGLYPDDILVHGQVRGGRVPQPERSLGIHVRSASVFSTT